MSTTIQQPSTTSGGSDSDESTIIPFLCKLPLFETTAASSRFQSAGTLCRSSIMRWDMGLAGRPSIMAGGGGGFGRGGAGWRPGTPPGFFAAFKPQARLTHWPPTSPQNNRTILGGGKGQ